MRKFNPTTMYEPHGPYFNAVEVSSGDSLIYASGIIGAIADGAVLEDPEAQIAEAWRNVGRFLDGCDLSVENLVRLKIHLTDMKWYEPSRNARIAALGEHMNATVTGLIVSGLFDDSLVIEIDVIAARPPA